MGKKLFDKLLIQCIYSPLNFFSFPIFLMNIDMNLAMVGFKTFITEKLNTIFLSNTVIFI